MSFSDTTSELSSMPPTDFDTAALNSSVIDSISPDNKITIQGVSYIKASAVGGGARATNRSWIWASILHRSSTNNVASGKFTSQTIVSILAPRCGVGRLAGWGAGFPGVKSPGGGRGLRTLCQSATRRPPTTHWSQG